MVGFLNPLTGDRDLSQQINVNLFSLKLNNRFGFQEVGTGVSKGGNQSTFEGLIRMSSSVCLCFWLTSSVDPEMRKTVSGRSETCLLREIPGHDGKSGRSFDESSVWELIPTDRENCARNSRIKTRELWAIPAEDFQLTKFRPNWCVLDCETFLSALIMSGHERTGW